MPKIVPLAVADRGHQRILGLDMLRSLAIIMVVIEHTIPYGASEDARTWIRILCAPDAVLFLMISGALLLPVVSPTGNFFRHRAVRVITPFMFWSMIYALLNWAFLTNGNDYYLAEQIKWLFLNPVYPEAWFIPVILSLYLFYPVISPWIRVASRKSKQVFIAVWLVALTLPYLHMYMGVSDYALTLFGCFYGFVGYAVAGYYLLRHGVRKSRVINNIVIIVVFVVAGIVVPAAAHYYAGGKYSLNGIPDVNLCVSTAAMAMLYFMVLGAVKRPANPSPVKKIVATTVSAVASYSYLIYLIHPLFGRYLLPNYMPGVCEQWGYGVVVFLLSLMTAMIVKRLPGLRHLLA